MDDSHGPLSTVVNCACFRIGESFTPDWSTEEIMGFIQKIVYPTHSPPSRQHRLHGQWLLHHVLIENIHGLRQADGSDFVTKLHRIRQLQQREVVGQTRHAAVLRVHQPAGDAVRDLKRK